MINTKRILVIGDVMLDIYYCGEVNRISPEAPVPVFKKSSERCVLGGASNVAANLVAANQDVSILALVGSDSDGKRIRDLFCNVGIDGSFVRSWDRPTITKTRFLAENNQQVLRLDIEDSKPIGKEISDTLLETLQDHIKDFDLILLSDYMKGLLTFDFTQGVIHLANTYGKKVLIDVKDPDYKKYQGAWLLKPNTKELNALTGMPVSTDEELTAAAKYLLHETGCEYVLTTCGAKGMKLVGKDVSYHLGTAGKSVYDVTGAGDTTIAYLSAAIANEVDIIEAMKLANYAAGIQVGKVGTSAVYLHEVEEAMKAEGKSLSQKIFHLNDRKELTKQIALWRDKGETVVTTNGCFDIIHRGHISLLEEAKTYGDHLVVLVNTDASVRRLKGPARPINSEEDRAIVLSALDCVDAVVLFDPATDNSNVFEDELSTFSAELRKTATEAPMGIIKLIAPDVHVKGGDYSVDQVPEAVYARKFAAVPFVKGYSTTGTIEKSRKQ